MKRLAWLLMILWIAPATLGAPIERGKRRLEDALRVALTSSAREGAPVAIVVDATPYTRAWSERIERALLAIGDLPASGWRIGRLGEPLLPTGSGPGTLAPLLPEILAKDCRESSTLRALRRSLRSFPDRGGRVLYLADWHFEDDEGLEPLIDTLRSRGQRFSVIGSEAAFGRGWHDGIDRMGRIEHAERIGRNAFRTERPGVAWHGGETAYNHLPHRFGAIQWQTEFFDGSRLASIFGREEKPPEDLRERLEKIERKPGRVALFPLPSSFGPYGLMRMAERTGGRYVLWSWNPSGRAALQYDYSRCDLFAPDLRSRSSILADVRTRPLARALLRAWHEVARRQIDLAQLIPPLARNLATPQSLDPTPRSGPLNFGWRRSADRDQFVKRANRYRQAADRAIEILAAAPKGRDQVDRRYRADADLFLHVLRVQRFSLGEAIELAKATPDQAWDEKDRFPLLRERTFIPETPAGAAPAAAHFEVRDLQRARELLEERTVFLRRYAGTPFAEVVRRNRVVTFVRKQQEHREPSGLGGLPGRMPAFSERDETPPSGPGAGSSGNGPSSG